MASSGGGKTNDEIVYDLAESILHKIPDVLDLDEAEKSLFEVRGKNTHVEVTCQYSSTLLPYYVCKCM